MSATECLNTSQFGPHPVGREHELIGHPGSCNCPVCFAYAQREWAGQ